MKRNKLIIVMIAVIAVGLFALPSTFSYQGAMHSFRQIDPTDADTINTFCMKCHTGTISTQLEDSNNGLYNGGVKIHSTVKCQGCHQITSTAALGNGYNKQAESTEHAARIPTCQDCHIANSYLLGVDSIGDAGNEILAGTEAHKDFASLPDVDISCIGCHTEATRTGMVTTGMQAQTTVYANLTIG